MRQPLGMTDHQESYDAWMVPVGLTSRLIGGVDVIGLGLGLGLMKSWSRSRTVSSRGLKSVICSSSVMTSDCVPCSVNTHIWSL